MTSTTRRNGYRLLARSVAVLLLTVVVVAGYLLRASMERAHTIGARQMLLEVAVDNLPAQQLYLEHGFEQVGTRPDYYHRQNGQRMAAHTMRCDLERWGNWPSLPAA